MDRNADIHTQAKWEFWVDRGGTFTDIVAKDPNNDLHTKKLLSVNPEAYEDAALHGIRVFLGLDKTAPIPGELVKSVKMGTTVATNALLEKKGEPTVLAITKGLGDIIEIGHQARPDTFALNIQKSDLLYSEMIEIDERVLNTGEVETAVNTEQVRAALENIYAKGYRSIAIVLMHSYKFPEHEKQVAAIAHDIGFTQVSASHDVSPLTKIVPRGETTIVDAYLTPTLQRYINHLKETLCRDKQETQLLFMQSSGGLTNADHFRGRDAILSGPAGGIVGAVHTAKLAGFDKIIGFDMGGTSTDVFHYAGEFEKAYETEVAGVRMRVPMMYIHTVAAGGGSLLTYEQGRFRVGPESAGADPGPACYRRGGDLAVTDINVVLGKIQPDYFPAIFGAKQNMPLDGDVARKAFQVIADDIADGRSLEAVAEGFLDIAIEHMAQAIKKISVSRGYDVQEYVLNCFGGAGGQHACLVAERLGMNTIFLHPLSGVLSAYGMGLADIRTESQLVFEQKLDNGIFNNLLEKIHELKLTNCEDLQQQGVSQDDIKHEAFALIRYKGTDTALKVLISDPVMMRLDFEQTHKQQFGFVALDKEIIVETIAVESRSNLPKYQEKKFTSPAKLMAIPTAISQIFSKGKWVETPIYLIEALEYGHTIVGPAVIVEPIGTVVIESGWAGHLNENRHIILERSGSQKKTQEIGTTLDPVQLEIFNNLFRSIAQQMGIVLRNTSQSVNVKERLDFSCALFDASGDLIANAPHVPVHLGSMDSSVKVVIDSGQKIRPGDVFVQNNPYNGGSHLPDITVISPVFDDEECRVLFYVASRAHHEDIGGIAPGSMSPKAKTIREEGIIFDCVKLVDQGQFQTEKIRDLLGAGPYPARNIEQNIADMMAQVAANATGASELGRLVKKYSEKTVHAYTGYIQDYAEEAVRKVISKIEGGTFVYTLDEGEVISVSVTVDHDRREATIDFTGTSPQLNNNFNAPRAITNAVVLYVFRCLVDEDIPLNAGCMKPLKIIVPEGSMLNPVYPAAVVAGNVETSQAATNALFAAIGVLGSSQGTMNNLTFGTEQYQYYETICSGSPAGPGFNGVAAVHTHMTNTRLTDPEILEQRYPVVLNEFSIRRGSGGKGKWNAGDGVFRQIRFLEPMECSILSGHRVFAPFGVKGGEAGQIGRNWIVRNDGTFCPLKGCAQTSVEPGDKIFIVTPTGGGFGKVESVNGDQSDMSDFKLKPAA